MGSKTLLASDPTHFGVILVGTGLTESILAAALSKAGYSVLHLDQSPIYGDESASLSLKELVALAHTSSATSSSSSTSTPSSDDSAAAVTAALKQSNHFSLSLAPSLLPALGPGIALLRRSRVAVYLQFALLANITFWATNDKDNNDKGESKDAGKEGEERHGHLVKVPMTKADIFNSPTLSLVQKRRVTKLLLFAAESEDDTFGLTDPTTTTFLSFLLSKFSIETSVAEIVAYALCLCTTQSDLALPTLVRLRTTLRSAGVYGPSPFLVGHYGGVGDLIGGFSRICAVWGGGQILGRKMGTLIPNSPVGLKAEPSTSGGPTSSTTPTPAPTPTPTSTSTPTTALGIPVHLDGDSEPADVFTADWIISSQSHLATLHPPSAAITMPEERPHSVQGIVVLNARIPFREAKEKVEGETEENEDDVGDSNLFVFPPGALCDQLGTATVVQVGNSTFSCPVGYYVLYLSAPLLSPSSPPPDPKTALQPYLTSLLSLLPPSLSSPSPILFTSYRLVSSSPPPPPSSLPPNFRVVPPLDCRGGTTGGGRAETAQLVSAVDQAAVLAEALFWEVVGEGGREEGVKFFAEEETGLEEEEV